MKSILQQRKECYITRSTDDLHKHHIYPGSNRAISEKHGFWIYLRSDWHTGSSYCVHADPELMLKLKKLCQAKYELNHSRDEFIVLIGRSYL